MKLSFVKVHPDAKLPAQGKPGDAAFDLYAVEDVFLAPGETTAIATGLQLADVQYSSHMGPVFLQIVGRSGLALKGIFPLGGIVDATYRGEIKVILHNGNQHGFTTGGVGHTDVHRTPSFQVKKGDRIAQMLIQRIVTNDGLNVVYIEEVDQATASVRGDAGFGSTGQ